MSKRNFILLIIILLIVAGSVAGFLYLRSGTPAPTDETPDTNFFSQFNPFANKTPTKTVTIPATETPQNTPPVVVAPVKKLTKVSSMPIAGFTVFAKERLKEVAIVSPSPGPGEEVAPPKVVVKKPTPPATEFAPALRYVDRATGNIYQTFVDKINEQKFSTTIIPRVYEAYFGNKGQSVVMQYLKGDARTIETFVGTLPKELLGGDTTGGNEIKGSFLPDNVRDVSLSPDNSKVFYLFESGDNMIGTILNLLNNKKVQIFDSPFTEWLSWWATSNSITLSTKPSYNVLGYMYQINSEGKNLNKILGGINGLTTLTSPDGKSTLFADNNLSLFIYHTSTRSIDQLGIRTLTDKCVWGKGSDAIYCAVPVSLVGNQYPDTWYQGEVSFSDQIWKIDAKTGNASMILDPITVEGGEDIDGIKLALDEGGSYLFFVNKRDSFLWELNLK